MNDATKRAIRSFAQVGTVQACLRFAQAFGAHLSEEQIAAITAVATPLLALVINLLEDHTAFPAVLK